MEGETTEDAEPFGIVTRMAVEVKDTWILGWWCVGFGEWLLWHMVSGVQHIL